MRKGGENSFEGQNKLPLIDVSLVRQIEKEDEEFSECHAWNIVNLMLCSWLLNIVDPKLRMTIVYSEAANIMWDDLKKPYDSANTPKIHQLKAYIANCKQGTLEIGEFYSKLVNLWNKFGNSVKVPMRTCSGCKCGAARQILVMYDEDKAHQFLMGFDKA